MKYCGVATPFKGVRVYTRTTMGMPGTETTLEEIMAASWVIYCRRESSPRLQTTSTAEAIALKSYSKTGREYSRHFTGVICNYRHQKQSSTQRPLSYLTGSGVPVLSVLVNTASIF